MIFVYRAAIVALATFVSALAGFGAHWFLPAAYVVESKGMVGSVVGLVASLLSLVLSLLIWTSHGLFTTQQSQLQDRSGVRSSASTTFSKPTAPRLRPDARSCLSMSSACARACGTTRRSVAFSIIAIYRRTCVA